MVDVELVAEQFKQPRFLLIHAAVRGRDIAGKRVRGFA